MLTPPPQDNDGAFVIAVIQAIAAASSVVIAVISGFYSARSASAAKRTAEIAADAQREQRAAVSASARQRYYRSIVSEPALAILGSWARDTLRDVSLAVEEARERSLREVVIVGTNARNPIVVFEARYYELRDTLVARTRQWPEPSLADAVTDILDALQDTVTEKLSSAQDYEEMNQGIRPLVEKEAAAIIQLVWRHDPAASGQALRDDATIPSRIILKRLH